MPYAQGAWLLIEASACYKAWPVYMQCTQNDRAVHKNRRIKMVENRMEYIAVSTGVVLTALVALIPFVS
jgi:hypothetical protein